MMTLSRWSLVSREGARARALTAIVLVVLAIALMASRSFAQEASTVTSFDLVGHVLDDEGRPLVGAFVALADSDWGSLTNEDGRFLIPDLYEGTVDLRVEQLGYEPLVWRGYVRAEEPVELRLTARPIVLEGLLVVTDRFRSRRNGTATSVRWFDRAALATSVQNTALDFVTTRAGLTRYACNGRYSTSCLLIRGRLAEPIVYVDEVPVIGGMEYLEAIQPHELYMIEVYGAGRHIRAYTPQFMERAAKQRLHPIALLF